LVAGRLFVVAVTLLSVRPPRASPLRRGCVLRRACGLASCGAAGAGLVPQRAFIIAPMRCSALALAWI
jgi:hypothetical protein